MAFRAFSVSALQASSPLMVIGVLNAGMAGRGAGCDAGALGWAAWSLACSSCAAFASASASVCLALICSNSAVTLLYCG